MTLTCGATAFGHLCVRSFPAKVNAISFLSHFCPSFYSRIAFLAFNYRIIWRRKIEQKFCLRALPTVITLNFAGERMKRKWKQ